MEIQVFKLPLLHWIIKILCLTAVVGCLNSHDNIVLSEPTQDGGDDFQSTVVKPEHHIERRAVRDYIHVSDFTVTSDIKYRYSRTCVTSRVLNNDGTSSHDYTFQVILPENAFISKFNMTMDGKIYEAYVKEKVAAKEIYNQAKQRGESAGVVELNGWDSNYFQIRVNIKAGSIVIINLTYEELLQRIKGHYEHVISVKVKNLEDIKVIVNIEESQQLRLLNARSEIELDQNRMDKSNENSMERPTKNTARVTWYPSLAHQGKLGEEGQNRIGKLIVEYDVKRELDGGEVLVSKGYFVHFFAPDETIFLDNEPLPKHVVFLLDISVSMIGDKITQLKEGMKEILIDLKEYDYLNIIVFSSNVKYWAPGETIEYHDNQNDDRRKQPFLASPANIKQTQVFIETIGACSDGANIHDALISAHNLIGKWKRYTAQASRLPPLDQYESIIMFLIGSTPTLGLTDSSAILSSIKSKHRQLAPVLSIAFGEEADFMFLRNLGVQSGGFVKKILWTADASAQLKGFYNEVASILLRDVRFYYNVPDNVSEVTRKLFETYWGGSEIVVAGKTATGSKELPGVVDDYIIVAQSWRRKPGATPIVTSSSPPVHSTNDDSILERLYAYLRVQQLIGEGSDESALLISLVGSLLH